MSDNIVVFKTVYPRTIVYLWLTNTTRMTQLEEEAKMKIKWNTKKKKIGNLMSGNISFKNFN